MPQVLLLIWVPFGAVKVKDDPKNASRMRRTAALFFGAAVRSVLGTHMVPRDPSLGDPGHPWAPIWVPFVSLGSSLEWRPSWTIVNQP